MAGLTEFYEWWRNVGSGIIPFARDDMEEHARRVAQEAWMASIKWRPISEAPERTSVLLFVKDSHVPMYIGQKRFGHTGEPQPGEFVWRCDSSGRFAHPTHFAYKPSEPAS